jgi:hypothetical protein
MDTATVTGAFALGGVVLGSVGAWLQAGAASRRAAARALDAQFALVVRSVDQLLMETATASYRSASRQPLSVDDVTTRVLPLLYEVNTAAAQLTMHSDRRVSEAGEAVQTIAKGLVMDAPADADGYGRRAARMRTAVSQLRAARDLNQARWWRLRYRRVRKSDYEDAHTELGMLVGTAGGG